MAERGYSIVKGRTEVMGTGRLFTGRKYVEEQPWEVSSNSGQAMRRLFVLLAIPLLTAVTPLDHALARGGGGGHGGGSHSSGTVRGSGYVNPSYHWTRAYYRRDGSYIPGHYQTNPNGTKLDNYSTVGNVNPWTGKPGWIWPNESGGTYYAPAYSGASNPGPVWSGAPAPRGLSGTSSSFAITDPDNPAQDTEVGSSRRSVPRRLNSTARGDLEIVPPAPPVVSSYHPHWSVNVAN